MMTFKQRVHSRCGEVLNDKVMSLKKVMHEFKESAANETKRTAGDKHETALAMLQIEQKNTNRRLAEALKQKGAFDKLNPLLKALHVTTGSLVETNKGWLFVSVALGKVVVDEIEVIALSPQSPLGAKLKGLKANDTAEINGTSYTILSVT